MKNPLSYRLSIVGIVLTLMSLGVVDTASAVSAKARVPGVPTNVTAVGGVDSAIVKWKAPVSNGGMVITSYWVTYFPGKRFQLCEGTKASCTITTADPTKPSSALHSVSFTFFVSALNAIGEGPSSFPSNPVLVQFDPSTADETSPLARGFPAD